MSRKDYLLPILLIVFISVAIYANTLKNGFVYDDGKTIVNNTLITDLGNLPTLLKKDYFTYSGESTYRPAVTFSYFLDYAVYGLKPWGYHLTNLLLHAANGALLYILLALLFQQTGGAGPHSVIKSLSTDSAFLGALLFVVHPIMSEAVNAVSFREDLLVFFFYAAALTLYLFLRSASRQSLFLYALSCALYFLSLLSKEMAVTLPMIVYCYEWIYKDKKNMGWRSFLPSRHNSGYVAVTITYGYLRFFHFLNPLSVEHPSWGLNERLLLIPRLLLTYLKLIAFPVSLSADYAISPISPPSSIQIISFIALSFIPAALLVRRKKPEWNFGILFFIVTLIPVYNIIPISNPLAERYLYLPMAGIAITAASLINCIYKPRCLKLNWLKPYLLKSFFLILIMHSFLVINRNRVWKNDYSLWSDTINKMPGSSRAHNNMGFIYFKLGRLTKAAEEFEYALRLNPEYSEAHNNLGFAYYGQKRLDEALQQFLSAVRLKPDYLEAVMNLGMVYYEKGELDNAEVQFKAVLRPDPGNHNAHNNLGVVYERQGRLNEAVAEYEIASRLNLNDPRYHFSLGSVYAKQRRVEEAKKEFRAVIKLSPEFSPARKALENMTKTTGDGRAF